MCDEAAFVAMLHFPRVPIAGDRAKTLVGVAEYMRGLDLKKGGWDYSTWSERRAV